MKRAITIVIAVLMIISMVGILAPTMSLFATPAPVPQLELGSVETAPTATP